MSGTGVAVSVEAQMGDVGVDRLTVMLTVASDDSVLMTPAEAREASEALARAVAWTDALPLSVGAEVEAS